MCPESDWRWAGIPIEQCDAFAQAGEDLLIVDGARPSRAAVVRIDSPATIAREISSRSANVNAVDARDRRAGRKACRSHAT